jgi:hypothetical protein
MRRCKRCGNGRFTPFNYFTKCLHQRQFVKKRHKHRKNLRRKEMDPTWTFLRRPPPRPGQMASPEPEPKAEPCGENPPPVTREKPEVDDAQVLDNVKTQKN